MRKLLAFTSICACFLMITGNLIAAEPKNLSEEMKYLGYSDVITEFSTDSLNRCKDAVTPKTAEPAPQPTVMDEANALTEQLNELGKPRSFRPEHPDRSVEAKNKLGQYWDEMKPVPTEVQSTLSPEFKNELKEKLAKELSQAGYDIKQLDLIDVPKTNQVRAVIRVVKNLKTKNSYKEIQTNLAEVKALCLNAGTIDGVLYLSEMTTFVAEDPKNKFYYEKTVLNP